ncbi:MAG TPA: MBL fold metallo-hydrolase [Streptosporangiaceae bacterium]|nr:MBL fold metallo-hydrolase [Streptosporangiaceae bacterium]
MTTGSARSRSARITKYTHSCVRIERDGTVLVIDPGIWSEPSALYGADAVLVTHEHGDHIDVLRLAGLGVPVYAPADARITGLDVIGVKSGESFTAAGFTVTAVRGPPAGKGPSGRGKLRTRDSGQSRTVSAAPIR